MLRHKPTKLEKKKVTQCRQTLCGGTLRKGEKLVDLKRKREVFNMIAALHRPFVCSKNDDQSTQRHVMTHSIPKFESGHEDEESPPCKCEERHLNAWWRQQPWRRSRSLKVLNFFSIKEKGKFRSRRVQGKAHRTLTQPSSLGWSTQFKVTWSTKFVLPARLEQHEKSKPSMVILKLSTLYS